MQIGILEPQDFSEATRASLKELGNVSLFEDNKLSEFIADKDILFIRLSHLIDKKFLIQAKKLKYICSPTTGLNHIDLEECERVNIKVISLKDENNFLFNIRATPEHTFGLALSLLRNYKKAFLNQQNNRWNKELYIGFELYENSVGIIGFGRVGKILAKYFEAFGAKVFFFDKDDAVKEVNSAVKMSCIEDVINNSNIIILSASYLESNKFFFDQKYIDLLKNKYFINTSRGELVDEDYLISKIEQGFFKGAAIDTISNEQSNNNLEVLLKLSIKHNLIITPHISGTTYNSIHRTEEFIFRKLIKKLKNESK